MHFIKQVLWQFSTDRCPSLAAALSYYTLFALPPLLYLLLMTLTFGMSFRYDGSQAEAKAEAMLQQQTAQVFGNQAVSDEVASILMNDRRSGGVWWKTLLGFAAIVVGATGVVASLQDALNLVWGVKPDPERSSLRQFVGKRILSLLMILGLGFLLLISLVVSSVVSVLGNRLSQGLGIDVSIAGIANNAVQAVVVMVIFSFIFKFMPDAIVRWSDVLVGAALTTMLFLIGRWGMHLYLAYASPGAGLSAAATSIAVLLVWVYYSAMIVLLGAEATQVLAVRFGAGIEPEKYAVRVIETIQRTDR
ncbi:MAG: YihY/virulence factor BrkB family protein [Pirellulaceae bacterium]